MDVGMGGDRAGDQLQVKMGTQRKIGTQRKFFYATLSYSQRHVSVRYFSIAWDGVPRSG
jgi:hypothetical protein